jgi:hypothetical protein
MLQIRARHILTGHRVLLTCPRRLYHKHPSLSATHRTMSTQTVAVLNESELKDGQMSVIRFSVRMNEMISID